MSLEFCLILPFDKGSDFSPDGNMRNFCGDTRELLFSGNYGSLEEFGFVPVFMSQRRRRKNIAWRDRVTFHREYSVAASYMYFDSNIYKYASSFEKIKLIRLGILKSLELISLSSDFDYNKFRKDYDRLWKKKSPVYEKFEPVRKRGRPRKSRPPVEVVF